MIQKIIQWIRSRLIILDFTLTRIIEYIILETQWAIMHIGAYLYFKKIFLNSVLTILIPYIILQTQIRMRYYLILAILYIRLFFHLMFKHDRTLKICMILLLVYLLYYINGNGAFPFPIIIL